MRIGFLEPQYLWALSALSVVVVLHLLKRPRTVKMPFSTLRFFSDAAVASNRARRLRNLLLFLIRMLIVLVAVLIFARPFIMDDPLRVISNPDSNLYVWIDPTLSMSYTRNGVSLSEKSHRFVDSLVEMRSSGNNGMYLYDHVRKTFRSLSDNDFTVPRKPVGHFDYASFSDACTTVIEADKRIVLLLISDFQESTSEKIETQLSGKKYRDIPVVAVTVTPEKPWNCSVRDARSGFGRETVISSRVSVSGTETAVACTLNAVIDNIRTPPVYCSLGRNGDTLLNILSSRRITKGWGTVRLQCGDPLAFDDTTWFIADRADSLSVLVIGTPRETFPVVAALKAAGNEKITSLESAVPELVSYEKCSTADVVIIHGFRSRSAAVQMLLNSQTPKKQTIICAAGESDSSTAAGISIPGYLKQSFHVGKAAEPLAVRLPDTLSDLWRGFPAMECGEVRVRGYRAGIKGISLLKLSNNVPLAVQIDDAQRRRWILFTTPLGISSENNLCQTGFYVPLLDRLVRYLISNLRTEDAPWFAGMRIKNPFYGKERGGEVVDMQGKPILHLHRQPFFIIEYPGVYKVIPTAAQAWFKEVLPDTAESRLVYQKLKKTGRYPIAAAPSEVLSYLRNHGSSFEWVLPWIILLVLLAGELILRDNRKRRE